MLESRAYHSPRVHPFPAASANQAPIMARSPDLDPRSDLELLEAFRRGDARAFEVLFDRHAETVFAFAFRWCGDHAMAEDVVQDCFADLLDRAGDFRLTGALSSWFYIVAKRRALRLHERTARERGEAETVQEAGLAVDAAEAGTAATDLRRLLARLPAPQQEVLVLRYLDGWDLSEIARVLGLPLGTVKSRIHNALQRLRQDPACRRYFER